MGKLYIGLLFIFFNFSVSAGNMILELIPTFVGYLFILFGIEELTYLSDRFRKVKPLVIVLFFYHAIMFLVDLIVGKRVPASMILMVIAMVSVYCSFYVVYCIIMGLKDAENTHLRCDLNSLQLYRRWNLWVISVVGTYFAMFTLQQLVSIGMLVSFISNILFLLAFSKAKENYKERFVGATDQKV